MGNGSHEREAVQKNNVFGCLSEQGEGTGKLNAANHLLKPSDVQPVPVGTWLAQLGLAKLAPDPVSVTE